MKKLFLAFLMIFSFGAYIVLTKFSDTASLPPLAAAVPNPHSTGNQTSSSGSNPPAGNSGQNTAGSSTSGMSGGGMMHRNGSLKNGSYVGEVADAYYGNIQVKAVVQNGYLSDVQILQYPNDRSTSIAINSEALPYLRSEAIHAQSANVDIVSGATDTSQAFQQSLASALSKARA